MLPRRPRLALPFTILSARDTVHLVAGEDVRYTLTEPGLDGWLLGWLPTLDGRTLLSAALDRLPNAHRQLAQQLVDQLYGERVLVDGVAVDAHRPAHFGLAPQGNAAWAVGWQSFLGGNTTRPLPVLCQDRLDFEETLRFNRQCRETGAPWFWATTGPLARAYVSPLFLPDAGPCWNCLWFHFRRLSPAPDIYDALTAHAQAGRPLTPASFPEPAVAILQQLLLWKAALAGEPEQPAALYRLHVLEVGSLEVTSHRVFVDPECPQCQSRN